MPPELSIIIPCYNERLNIAPLVARLDAALTNLSWEAIFVDDDSPDGTSAAIRAIATTDPRIRCLRRIGRRGLASAVIEGALSASSPVIAVIDGDGQHDETRLPIMLSTLRANQADIVVASRFAPGGDATGLPSPWRHALSAIAIRATQALTGVALTDPMSGFFMLPQPLFERLAPHLTGHGFKILLDLLLSAPRLSAPRISAPLLAIPGRLRVQEIGARFHARREGESKLDLLVMLQFAALLLDKATAGAIPLRFLSFALVGAFGLLVHLAILATSQHAGASFGWAQTVATVTAMVANFQLNNLITYRDQRLRGARLWRGLALFMLVCGIGAIANIGIARALYYSDHTGWTPAGAIGALIGVVWNYAMSATLVWGRRKGSASASF